MHLFYIRQSDQTGTRVNGTLHFYWGKIFVGQQQGLQKFYAPTLQLGPNRRHHDQADSQTGFSTGR